MGGVRLRRSPGATAPSPARPASGRQALLLALGAFIVLRLTVPPTRWEVALLLPTALGLAAAAVWMSRRARQSARITGERAPGALPAFIVGGLTLFLSVATSYSYLAVPEMRGLNNCLIGANTETAKSACWSIVPKPELRRLETP